MRKNKLLEKEELQALRDKNPSLKIVHCHGVFDVLHAGHLAYFESAKKFGDILVVTVTSDEFVNKGPGRPHFNSRIRANMLAALEVIDFVAVSRFSSGCPMIELLKPHFYVKGPDYKDKSRDVTGAIFLEEKAVEKGGGKLVFTDDATFSSSELINKFFNPWSEEQNASIALIKGAGGYDEVERVLDRVSQETVQVVGEPIVDTYIFSQPEALSSKSPSISAKYLFEENYAGGSLAIANHLSDFVKLVTLTASHGGEAYFSQLLKAKLDPRVKFSGEVVSNAPTPRKTRYISIDKSERIFEITDLKSDQWTQNSPKKFCEMVKSHNQNEGVTILADFGHGLFEGEVLRSLEGLQGFVGLNVQTNSSNFGFNPFTKHKRFDFLSIDTREARMAYHDRESTPLDLAKRISGDLKRVKADFAMTLGAKGSYYFPKKSDEKIFAPAFADSVVDTTGAGDAFFCLASLLVKVQCPEVMIPFLSNVFAGLKTRIIGNKSAVSRAQLLKAVGAILK